jgi:transcriptional regulator with XRE-family HTH domain
MSNAQSAVASSVAAKEKAVLSAHIGSRIRSRRLSMGLSADSLAQAIGVPVQMVDQFECGSARIDPAQLFRLSEALGASIRYFFQRD